MNLGEGLLSGHDLNLGPQPVPVRACPLELNLEVPQVGGFLTQVTDQNERRTVEVIGHDVQVAILIDVEQD